MFFGDVFPLFAFCERCVLVHSVLSVLSFDRGQEWSTEVAQAPQQVNLGCRRSEIASEFFWRQIPKVDTDKFLSLFRALHLPSLYE